MQAKKADHLREKWGDKPCDHPRLEREIMHGAPTGDYVCTTCGRADKGSNWNERPAADPNKPN